MKKLTQQEASDLIQKAWEEVSRHTLGSYRFGQVLYNLLPEDMHSFWRNISADNFYCEPDFYYEPDSNIATEKFYKYFVEGNDDHI